VGVDPEPTPEDPNPKLTLLREEFACAGSSNGDNNVSDPFFLELIDASSEGEIKRRDLYDDVPLLTTVDPQHLLSPWAKGPVVWRGDAAGRGGAR